MFFDNWSAIFRVLAVGSSAYVGLIVILRLSGKRTLSKWNAFDFVVTIALGSILASVVLSKDISLADGFVALILLIVLQFVITSLSVRFDWVKDLIKSKPTLLFDKGDFLAEVMKQQRVGEAEIRTAIRAFGSASVEEIEAVVLETDGSLSVVKKSSNGLCSALKDVS